ncbi:MAG: hypothetical protein ABI273_22645 [Lacunisphaera sp.]
MNLFRRLFEVPPEPRSVGGIILWWEIRRLTYWLFVAVVGFSGAALMIFSFRNAPVGEEGFEPFLPMMLGIFGSNVCYTGGWIAELAARKMWREKVTFFGPVAFSLGLIFTALLCLVVPLMFALCSI